MTSRQANIRKQFICEKHFDETDFEECGSPTDDLSNTPKRLLKDSKLTLVIFLNIKVSKKKSNLDRK